MIRPLASSFAALAMAVIVIRGAIESAAVDQVVGDAFVGGFAFAILGGVSGWILDYVVREHVRLHFENRLQWYRHSIAQNQSAATNDVGQISAN